MPATLTDSKIYGPDTQKKEKGRIVGKGIGCFLCPPNHPEYSFSVETELRRRPENRGCMSLSTAAECNWLDAATRQAARVALVSWERQPIGSPKVVAWIRQVLGYFKGCYKGDDSLGVKAWHAGNLRINQDADPLASADLHAGVHLIRKYYPEYVPTAEDFNHAKWGD